MPADIDAVQLQDLAIEQTGHWVHNGVMFSFSRHGQEWQKGLAQLSGGQRSIVSLALIFAVSCLSACSVCSALSDSFCFALLETTFSSMNESRGF